MAVKYTNSIHKKTAWGIRLVCGFLFVLFCILYLYGFQSDWLALTQHLASQGRTSYSPLWGMVLITLLLLGLQMGFSRLLVFPVRFHALTFFPSCLLLALCTDYRSVAFGAETAGWNWSVYVLVVIIYAVVVRVVWLFPDVNGEKETVFACLWPNAMLMSLLLFMAGSAGNAQDSLHYKLRVARLLEQGEEEAALEVGKRSDATNHSLTALRAYALSRQGRLGDKLFEYPQHYGSRGLLLPKKDSLLLGDWPKRLYRHLGRRPASDWHGDTRLFLERVAGCDSVAPAVGDYLLCTYLLDKNLDNFVRALPNYYVVSDSLPRHYKEALILYSHLRMKPVIVFREGAVSANYEGFQEYRSRYSRTEERRNRCRDMYGGTYWYYYYFQEPVAL